MLKKIIFTIAIFLEGLIVSQNALSQDFPNALALIQYLNGVNASKIPKVVRADLDIEYFKDYRGPNNAEQFFICGESKFELYDLPIGINAKVHIDDSLVIILKSEKIFETDRIDIENFLMFGIHKQDPLKSLTWLKQLGIDTEIIDDAIRLGREMWVIGAYRREANTPQVWIDKEKLVVKKIHYINLPQQKVEQMEWSDFRELGDFYVPMKCELRSDPELLYRLQRQNLKELNSVPDEILKILDY